MPPFKSKEQEVLERQRMLAASMKMKHTATTTTAAPKATDNKPKATTAATTLKRPTRRGQKPKINTSDILAAARSRAKASATTTTAAKTTTATLATTSKSSSVSVSAPSKQNATIDLIDTDDEDENDDLPLAQLASKASKPDLKRGPSSSSSISLLDSNSQAGKGNKSSNTDLPKLSRKPKRASSSSLVTSSLASLVKRSVKTSNDAILNDDDDYEQALSGSTSLFSAIQTTSLPTLEPDHFWKHLRDWDFLTDLSTYNDQAASTVSQSNNKNNNKDKNSNTSDNSQNQNNNSSNNSNNSNPDADVDNNKTDSKSKEESDNKPSVSGKKPLPNIFLNSKHYVAAWAPLLLAETRAQWISEVLANNGPPIAWWRVQTQITSNGKKGGRSRDQHFWEEDLTNDTNFIKIIPSRDNHGAGNNNHNNANFATHDLALLIPINHKDSVRPLFQGRPNIQPPSDTQGNWKKCAIVGHAVFAKKELHGLMLQVSKKKWAFIGQDEMWLVKLGGNVTALREFTALCRIEHIPMKRFLFGQHLEREQGKSQAEQEGNNKKSNNNDNNNNNNNTYRNQQQQQQKTVTELSSSKKDLLETMGGSQALGKGFTAYVQKKFNPSQLTAIAASAHEYGEGGFTLIKGPPGTGKTTTLVAVLNSLHIRQYNKYYDEVRKIAARPMVGKNCQFALDLARKSKPRLLVCAPSNAAVDNVILKIMEDGFVDGSGCRYNPSMIRIGVGKSTSVKTVALEEKVDAIVSNHLDFSLLDATIANHRIELQRVTNDMSMLRRRVHAIAKATDWPLSKNWEIRVDDNFEQTQRVYFVNHKEKATQYEVPPPPEPGETHFPATAMPEYRSYMSRIVKLVENAFAIKSALERCTIIKNALDNGANDQAMRQALETHVLNSVHLTMTTLGTSGGRALDGAEKFEVVVIDEAAQSVEPSALSALSLGSRHCVMVGDPQQLPATIFNVSGRNTKYDRSLFQRLEEAGQPVYMLNQQYRMHPKISHFPRHIFYGGTLLDGPNVVQPNYGNPLRKVISANLPNFFQPFMVLDLDSKEERGGTSLSNSAEAQLAVYLYTRLNELSNGSLQKTRVAVITPYSQQTHMLTRYFSDLLGPTNYQNFVEINTVDAYQGREANIVIFSAVRASGVQGKGIGFLSDVRRMNVALTRAKHFLFVIARCDSIVINPYWRDLVQHARENNAVLRVPMQVQQQRNFRKGNRGKKGGGGPKTYYFGNLEDWNLEREEEQHEDYYNNNNSRNYYGGGSVGGGNDNFNNSNYHSRGRNNGNGDVRNNSKGERRNNGNGGGNSGGNKDFSYFLNGGGGGQNFGTSSRSNGAAYQGNNNGGGICAATGGGGRMAMPQEQQPPIPPPPHLQQNSSNHNMPQHLLPQSQLQGQQQSQPQSQMVLQQSQPTLQQSQPVPPLQAPGSVPLMAMPLGAPMGPQLGSQPIEPPVGLPTGPQTGQQMGQAGAGLPMGPIVPQMGQPIGAPVGQPINGPMGQPMSAPMVAPMGPPVAASMGPPMGPPTGAPLGAPMGAPMGTRGPLTIPPNPHSSQQLGVPPGPPPPPPPPPPMPSSPQPPMQQQHPPPPPPHTHPNSHPNSGGSVGRYNRPKKNKRPTPQGNPRNRNNNNKNKRKRRGYT